MKIFIQRIEPNLFCPSCNAPRGYLYENLKAQCVSCNIEKDVFELFNEALNSDSDSDLWSFAFHILANFKIAPIYEGFINNVTYRAFEKFEVDLNKAGLSKKAKIIFLNFTPSSFVMPTHLFGHNKRSIDDIEHKLVLFGTPLGLKYKAEEKYGIDTSEIDTAEFHNASLFIRWFESDTNIFREHMVKAAENHWKDEIPLMVYNAFSAFELNLSLVVENFWKNKKGLSDHEYSNIFDKMPISKKMDSHLALICRENKISFDQFMPRMKLLEHLRLQRNSVVHTGDLRSDKETNKNTLYSISCWAILFLEMLETLSNN